MKKNVIVEVYFLLKKTDKRKLNTIYKQISGWTQMVYNIHVPLHTSMGFEYATLILDNSLTVNT